MNLISEPKTSPKKITGQVLSIIGLITCVIGGIFVIAQGIGNISSQIFSIHIAAIGKIVAGIIIIIGALTAFKYNTGGMSFCLIIGIFTLIIGLFTRFFVFGLLGPLLTLVGSLIGLIGVVLISPEQTKKLGILVVIISCLLLFIFGYIYL